MLKLCECLDNQSIKITTRFSGSIVTSLDSVNGWSIQTFLRGEKDLKQSDEIQATDA